jgi:trehalose 6-phosphate synthase/phosphatase
MVVTPLRDGMNLVAKEYVASRTDDSGVLILSEFAGAADELTDALLVNPYDIESVAHALSRAATMTREEQGRRMRELRRHVHRNNVHVWARDFLAALTADPRRASRTPPSTSEALVERLRAADELSLFLDYDGTLVDLADRPDAAIAGPELKALLRALAARPRTEVHVVSGRSIADLERILGDVARLRLHAEHGAWSRRGDEWLANGKPSADWKPEVVAELARLAARTPGAFVEEKLTAVAFHYRLSDPELASTRLRDLRLALHGVARTHDLEVVAGAKVVEVRRRDHGVRRVLEHAPQGALVVAAADDASDDLLLAEAEKRGVGVRVGSGPTASSYRVASPLELRALLQQLVD